jgi:hypothetical protein
VIGGACNLDETDKELIQNFGRLSLFDNSLLEDPEGCGRTTLRWMLGRLGCGLKCLRDMSVSGFWYCGVESFSCTTT